ncbi:hypothetical protein BCR32DRAFT_290700 [Anaeromyces robustus]|uniref:PH domain-containing protein n=1 Tax=Anaeromyces robustus TaxID=1754192 RepID=A0A1Y1XI00_9FUNG|nr:hypothetical protein BCR32DRAFT_290700 [Anaeromyces robustus]|eukprot:ORX85401.1 hypothetical protein BCR32DRAFT_290700 [Anaeromyces robustus]
MSAEHLNGNVSIQLENWLEKHSRSYPRRWLKRYFRFDGMYLSYSKNDSSKSAEKYKVNISDILDVKMKSGSDGKNILLIIMRPLEEEKESENELEILMPNPQMLKIWYNSINECIESKSKASQSSINHSKEILECKGESTRSLDDLHPRNNKPSFQPNIQKNKGSDIREKSLPDLPTDHKSNESLNKKTHEKSSALSKLDALLGDLQHSMGLSEIERKSVMILNNYERIGLSPLSNKNSIEQSYIRQNRSIDNIHIRHNEKGNPSSTGYSNRVRDVFKDLIVENDDKKLKTSSMPPEGGKKDENEGLSMKSKFNISDPSMSVSGNNITSANKKNTIINKVSPTIRENDELISDVNKKINLNLNSNKDGTHSKSNSYVYNMAVNNYTEKEGHSRNNSESIDNGNVNNLKSNHSSGIAIVSPVVAKPKQQLEVYTQFEASLNSSLEIVDILIQILDISTDTVEIYFTEYKEVILTKSSDLINKSSSLFKQINDESRQHTSISISETAIITKNPKMIDLGNDLASIIRRIVSSLKIYLKIVKKDVLLQASEYDIKSMVNSEIENNKKLTINELKQSMNNLKSNLLTIKKELQSADIPK